MKNSFNLVFISIIIFFLAIGYYYYIKMDSAIKRSQEYLQITDELAQSKIEVISQKEITNKLKNHWDSEKSILLNQISQLSSTSFSLKNSTNISKSVDLQIFKDGKRKYLFHELHFSDGDKLGPPIGYVMIYDDGHVVSKIYKHHIDVNQAQSLNRKTGKYVILNKADFVLEQSGLANRRDSSKYDWTNKPYPLNVLNSEVVISNDTPKFKFFDPKISLSASVSNLGFGLGGSFSMSSYARFRFFRVGVEKNINNSNNYDFFLAPFEYNISRIFNNTFVYPLININENSNVGGGIGLSVNF